jgi:hypothetical protein
MPDLAEQMRSYVDRDVPPMTAEDVRTRAAGARRRGRRAVAGVISAGVVLAVGLSAIALDHRSDHDTRPIDRGPRPTTTTVPDPLKGYDAIRGNGSGAPVRITAIRTGLSPREIVIAFTDDAPERVPVISTMEGPKPDPDAPAGACVRGYTVAVDRRGSVPRVSVRAVVDPDVTTVGDREHDRGVCVGTGIGTTLRARLAAPLAGTTVIDSATGASLPVFDGSTLLAPTVLPAAMKPAFTWVEAGGWNASYTAPYNAISIALCQGYTGTVGITARLQPVRSVEVAGHEAELLADGPYRALHWMHGSMNVLVMIQPIDATADIEPILFAFAEGLR